MSTLVPKVARELTKMKRTLRDLFNLDKLRPGQAEVIRSVLEGNNTLAIMPTGAGKSLGLPPVLALTATTTPAVIADIEKQLDLVHLLEEQILVSRSAQTAQINEHT